MAGMTEYIKESKIRPGGCPEPCRNHHDQPCFYALSESIHDGRLNLLEAGKLADGGRVRFSTILKPRKRSAKWRQR